MPDETQAIDEQTPETTEEESPKEEEKKGPVEAVEVGSMVLFVLDNGHQPNAIRPAIVVNVDQEDKSGLSRVDLQVFTAGDKDFDHVAFTNQQPHFRYDVCYSADKVANSWHWKA